MENQLLFDLTIVESGLTAKQKTYGKPRFNSPKRNQVSFKEESINDLIPEEHRARQVWEFVNKLDLSSIALKTQSVEGKAGRSATDPKLLFSIWLFGIIEGIGSARTLEKYCKEHKAFIWLCGNVNINHHTLSDFRNNNSQELDDLFTQTLAALMSSDVVSIDRTAQDGMRVRAGAGASSFRRKPTLKKLLKEARSKVKNLKKELDEDPGAYSRREKAAKERAARERVEKLEKAFETMKKIDEEIDENKARRSKKEMREARKKARASTTDPDARTMKMSNGGYNPGYNFQFATDTKTRVIIGVDVTQNRTDTGELIGMLKQMNRRASKSPSEHLLDAGYVNHDDIEEAKEFYNCDILVPPKKTKKVDNPYLPLPSDSPVIVSWRKRMGTDAVKEIYKLRASTAEYVNARARSCGFHQMLVRGLGKVKSMACMYAIAHNMMRGWILT